ncbi:hypothetical protein GSI_09671 [Ganoderma sinense ZZ0214-1]|uniref:Uncharacterized protein n=1 Tax=Ganoderma sinense ZZ0214-1 TaxID=1077348 RepID=A0A2G8S3B5_9APHY|nr:hypothetical protein GSI_09671 [Ganoderma sinense ZZ0214-1]
MPYRGYESTEHPAVRSTSLAQYPVAPAFFESIQFLKATVVGIELDLDALFYPSYMILWASYLSTEA